MTRIKVFVEGQTEETFVRDVLDPYFASQGIYLTAILAQTSPGHKGGIVSYAKIRHQIDKLCKDDSHCWITTLIDFYKFPKDAPGRQDESYSGLRDCYDKVNYLQERMATDIGRHNFVPFLMLHEFEAILFCQPEKMAEWLDDVPVGQLRQIADSFSSPEEINEGEQTAPSKRIVQHVPRYKKTAHGPIVAEDIGLDAIRVKCPHFNRWLEQIAAL